MTSWISPVSPGPDPELGVYCPHRNCPGPTLVTMSPPADESSVLIDGPWNHRFVSANGSRFHVVEAGTGPLVLFLHGFPEFWWAWQHQVRMLADAGFRAVAIDLRGYGASDKPPRGYDGYTMAGDVAGLIRALGERSAVLVGGGYGGAMAWTTAAFHPKLVRRLVITSAAHPLRLRAALFADPRGQLAAAGPMLKFQLPRYEHVLTRDGAALVGRYLYEWGGRAWVTGGRSARCCGCTGTASSSSSSSRSSRRPCTCTERRTPRCCLAPRRARAATWSPRTSGGCSTGSGTSRTPRRPTW